MQAKLQIWLKEAVYVCLHMGCEKKGKNHFHSFSTEGHALCIAVV